MRNRTPAQDFDTWRCRLPALPILVAVALWSGAVAAEESEPDQAQQELARDHFERAVGLFGGGDHAGALAEFRRAFEAWPNPALRYNLGVCHFQLEQWPEARREFGLYLAEMDPSAIAPDRREEVEQTLVDIDARIGLIDIEASQPEAMITVDGEPAGTTPLRAPLPLSPGAHQLRVELDGHQPFTHSVTVNAGERQSLEATLEPIADVSDTPPVVESRRRLSRVWFGVATGLALAMGLGGAIAGGIADGRESDFYEEIDDCIQANDRACPEAHNIADSGTSLATTANALFISAGVMAAVAVVLAIFTDWGGDEGSDASVSLVPLTRGRGGLSGALLDASLRF